MSPDKPTAFRFHPGLWPVLGVTAVALLLPLGVLLLGLRSCQRAAPPRFTEPPGLRSTLESIADRHFEQSTGSPRPWSLETPAATPAATPAQNH